MATLTLLTSGHGYDEVQSIHPGKDSWRVLVKVIRLWYGQSFNGSRLPSSLELVVMDAKGVKVHVFIKKTLMYKFERILRDGQVFAISYFEVVPSSGMFKPTRHPSQINLQLNTEVKPIHQFPINADTFSFVDLADVLAPDFDTSFLIDVVGILTGVGSEREIVTNGKKVMMNVIEIDCSGTRMECALFGSYNEQLNIFLRAGEMFNVLIVLQFVKVKKFQDRYSLQNVHGATKILFNPDMPIATTVRERFTNDTESGSQSLTQLQDSTKGPGDDDFLILTPRKTISELNDNNLDGCFVIAGTVSYVELGHDWWYTACKCNKKVYADEKMYFCEVCNRHVVTVFPRFRLQLMVHDATGNASILLFDKEATILVGKTCAEVVDKNDSNSGLPPEISALVDKKFLFKVEVKISNSKFDSCRYGPSLKVKKVCMDPHVIEQFEAAVLENSVGITSSRLLTTPPAAIRGGEFAKDLLEDFVVVSTGTTNCSKEVETIDLNDDTQQLLNTKRSSSPEADATGSCTLKKKKAPAKVKKEK